MRFVDKVVQKLNYLDPNITVFDTEEELNRLKYTSAVRYICIQCKTNHQEERQSKLCRWCKDQGL